MINQTSIVDLKKRKKKKEKISLRLLNRIRPSERNVIHHVKKSGNKKNKKKREALYIFGGDYMWPHHRQEEQKTTVERKCDTGSEGDVRREGVSNRTR